MSDNKPMTSQDLRVLYDLSIYNCVHFGPYTQIIYEDLQNKLMRQYTNIEVAREATQLAAGLRAMGIEKGDRVIVMMPNCPEVVISYQAIARAGAVIIPVLPLLKGTEVRYIAENSGAKAIVTSALLVPMLQSALSALSTLHYIIATGVTGTQLTMEPQLVPYADVLAKGADKADAYLTDLDEGAPATNDMSVILYTSGTTGHPKGVVLTQRNLIANAISAMGVEQEIRSAETQLAILPLAHSYGIVACNIAYLTGVTVVMHPRFDPTSVLSAIERYKIVSFAGVPAM